VTDTFLEQESSREDGDAVELYAITINLGQAYYLTSAIRDIAYDGRTYKAVSIDRGEVATDTTSDERAMEILLAVDHPIVRRWTTYGVPPKRTSVVCTRLFVAAEVAEVIWEGDVTGLSWEGEIAKLRVPGRLSDAIQRRSPLSCSSTCTHILYDGNCGVSQTGTTPGGLSHRVTTTAISVNGRDVRVDLGTTDRNGTWALGGTLTHVATGESMSIGNQADVSPGTTGIATLTMQAQILELKAGDSVRIQRGCAHTIADCRDSFDNVDKFSGYPDLPSANPFETGKI
jgi:hypothetical protein